MPLTGRNLLFWLLALTAASPSCQSKALIGRSVDRGGGGAWLQESGGTSGSSFRANGPQPPLRVLWQQEFNGAPLGASLLSGKLLLQVTKTGSIYGFDRYRGDLVAKKGLSNDVCGPAAIAGATREFLVIGELGRKPTLRMLDMLSGEDVWERRGAVCASAVVRGDTLLVVEEAGPLLALAVADGRELWRWHSEAILHNAPALADTSVYLCDNDGIVHALSASDGSERWQHHLEQPGCGRPALAGGLVITAAGTGAIQALSAASGDPLWHTNLGALPTGFAVAERTLAVGSADRHLYGLDISTGEVIWSFATGAAVRATPAASSSVVYAASNDGHFYTLDLATGKLLWKYSLNSPVSQPVAVAGETVAVATDAGTVFLFGRH